jgi:hypothetical protein
LNIRRSGAGLLALVSLIVLGTSPAYPFGGVKISATKLKFAKLNLKTGPDSALMHFSVKNPHSYAVVVTVEPTKTAAFGITEGEGQNIVLNPGQKERVIVNFAPPNTGKFKDKIHISTFSGENYVVKLKGSATGGAAPLIFATNQLSDSVTAYPTGADGDVTPFIDISGDAPLLFMPNGIALDSDANVYVVNGQGGNSGNGSVTMYLADSTGNVAPSATITGSNTGMETPSGIALDSQRNIYIVDEESTPSGFGALLEYAAGSDGNAKPSAEISGCTVDSEGDRTIRGGAVAIRQDTGDIYTTGVYDGESAILVYAQASNGCSKPKAVIAGLDTGLDESAGCNGIALNQTSDDIYCDTLGGDTIFIYQAGSEGDVVPKAIKGNMTGLETNVGGIAVDLDRNDLCSRLPDYHSFRMRRRGLFG